MHTHIGRAVPSGGNARAKLPPTIVTNANLRVSSLHESWLVTLSLYDVAVGTRRSSTHTQKAVTTLNEIGNCTVCNIRCSRVPNSFSPCSRVCQSQRPVFQQTECWHAIQVNHTYRNYRRSNHSRFHNSRSIGEPTIATFDGKSLTKLGFVFATELPV